MPLSKKLLIFSTVLMTLLGFNAESIAAQNSTNVPIICSLLFGSNVSSHTTKTFSAGETSSYAIKSDG